MTGERFVVRETDATSVGVPVCQSVKDFVESRAFRYFLKRFCRQQRIPDEREARLSFLLTSAVNGNPGNYDSLTVFLKDSAVQGAIRRFIGGLDATITPDDIARITDPEVRALFESVFISRDPKALTDVFCRSIDRVLASTTSINATRLPWSEVPRDRDVHMFGDTNGSIESLRNLEHAGIVELRYDAQGKITGLAWRGGSSVAVVVGDIFADRNLDSFALSKAFRILREQARRA